MQKPSPLLLLSLAVGMLLPAAQAAAASDRLQPAVIAKFIAKPIALIPAVGQRSQQQQWQQRLSQPGASFIKVQFSAMQLPVGAYVTVSSADGRESYRYPDTAAGRTFHSLRGEDGEQQFSAMSVFGDSALVTLVLPAGSQWQAEHQLRIAGFNAGFSDAALALAETGPGTSSTCGSNQRKDAVCAVNSQPREYDRSRPVARLLIGGSGLCTGWRVGAGNHLFTNNHCVATASELRDTEVWFNYQNLQCGVRSPATVVKVTGAELFKTDYNLDYTLFSVNNFAAIAGFGHLGLTVRLPTLGERIYIPQHGAGNPKELAIESEMNSSGFCEIDQAVTSGRATGTDTGYYCDTIGGSSGSPVLAQGSHGAIALHHFGGCTNQGVLINKIWPQVAAVFNQQIPVGDDQGNGNLPPVAAFTVQCQGYQCQFDGHASQDPEGGSLSYSWQFGDGNQGSGIQTAHQYQGPGRYSVLLNVTDPQGLTASKASVFSLSDAIVYPLLPEQVVTLSGALEQHWNYRVTGLSAGQLLELTLSQGSGDAGLYARVGASPDVNLFDCRSIQNGNQESCRLYLTSNSDVYLQVVGQQAFSDVQLLARIQQTPPNGYPKTGLSAAKSQWLRYQYLVPAGVNQLKISTAGGTGDADLYVQKTVAPTTTLYDCRPYSSGNNESCIIAVQPGELVHIGLRAFQTFSQLTLDLK